MDEHFFFGLRHLDGTWNLAQSSRQGGAVSPLTGHDLVNVVDLDIANRDRLQDPELRNGGRQLREGGLVDVSARLGGVRTNAIGADCKCTTKVAATFMGCRAGQKVVMQRQRRRRLKGPFCGDERLFAATARCAGGSRRRVVGRCPLRPSRDCGG
jgi:hypothetical protein